MKSFLIPLLLLASCSTVGDQRDAPNPGDPGQATSQPQGPQSPLLDAEQTFAGLWNSTYGRLTLAVNGTQVTGTYPAGTIAGRLDGERLIFTFAEGQRKGDGWFELAPDARAFDGQWHNDGSENWNHWTAKRIPIHSDKRWLVILEAPWQEGMNETDYSFGGMLRGIFAHVEGVEVRQRFFTDRASFEAYCQEISLLPGEVYLCVATHATIEGLQCQAGMIRPEEVAQALRHAPNLKLIHFSACEVMAGDLPQRILDARPAGDVCEGISGYDVSVDWMASALTEFAYFDLLLNRGLSPQLAAKELVRALDFADDEVLPGSAIPAAHFRFRAVERDR